MSRIYTTKTASLKATIADIRNLDAKNITVNGEKIILAAKHANDTRETVTENDLWGQYAEVKDGQVIVHDDWVSNTNDNSAWNSSITKVENNKAYVGDTLYANIQTEKIKDGSNMFESCSSLTSFTSDLSSLTNGDFMFMTCSTLTTFTSDLSSLTCAVGMFDGCSNLTTFTRDLSSLTDGTGMFGCCSNLTIFTSDLSSLNDGSFMFDECTNLTTFTRDLSSLVKGDNMFGCCSNLTTFTSDLSSLINGSFMFSGCTNLTTFTSDLSSLINGTMMFYETNLTPQSVMYIAESIKDIATEKKLHRDGIIPYVTKSGSEYSATKGFMNTGTYIYTYNNPQLYTTSINASDVGKITIGINVTNDTNTITDQLQAFAEEATFDSWADLKQAFVDKGWTVTWQYGGTYTSITYDMRGDRAIPCTIYAQLVEEENKDHAEYTNEDGSKFYNINWGHDVTHPQEFQQFDSLEDAMVAYGVILKQSNN